MKISIDRHRVSRELSELAAFSDTPAPAVTRIVFTQPDLAARAWLKNLCREVRLQIREDTVGNLFARWPGTDPSLAAVGTGSHIDAIPNSGRFDGTVGVLAGLEAIRALQSAGFKPRRSIELLLFTSEEPTRFGIGCLGSRLLSRTLNADAADRLIDPNGMTLRDVRVDAGFIGPLDSVPLPDRYYEAFLELHIEQGPILERENVQIGIVTHIAAPATLRIRIEGEGGHAGAVLMPQRRDAFLAASELALAIEAAALATGSLDTVATTGVCTLFPGAVNSIPSRVQMEVDIRDIDLPRRDSVVAAVTRVCDLIGSRRKVAVSSEILNADPPASCDSHIQQVLIESCAAEGLGSRTMISRAYHDSLFMSRTCPVAMLFIPCSKGLSHRPDEYASDQDIAAGTLVLARTLASLAA